jgi:ribonuclease P/MRP protein subunit POP5
MTQLPKMSKQDSPRSCVMQVVRVSGTIKKAEEEAIKRARAAILRAKRENGEGGTDNLMNSLGHGHSDDDAPSQSAPIMAKITGGSEVSDEDEMDMDSDDRD